MINYWLAYSILLPALAGLVYYRSIPPFAKLLVIQVWVGFFVEVTAQWWAYKLGNNLILYYGYIAILIVINGLLFERLAKRRFRLVWILLVVLIAEYFYRGGFPSFTFLLLDIFVVLSCMYAFKMVVNNQLKLEYMWILGTMLFYFFSATIYLTLHQSLDRESLIVMSNIWAVSNLVSNVSYTGALWRLGLS